MRKLVLMGSLAMIGACGDADENDQNEGKQRDSQGQTAEKVMSYDEAVVYLTETLPALSEKDEKGELKTLTAKKVADAFKALDSALKHSLSLDGNAQTDEKKTLVNLIDKTVLTFKKYRGIEQKDVLKLQWTKLSEAILKHLGDQATDELKGSLKAVAEMLVKKPNGDGTLADNVADARKKLEQAKRSAKDAQKDFDEALGKIQQAQVQLDAEGVDTVKVQADLDQAEGAKATAEDKLKDATHAVQALEVNLDRLEALLKKEQDSDVGILRNKIKDLNQDLKETRHENTTLTSKVERLEEQLETLKKEQNKKTNKGWWSRLSPYSLFRK